MEAFVKKPWRSSIKVSAKCLFKGYISAFLTISTISAFYQTMSAANKQNESISHLVNSIGSQSYDIGLALLISTFPIFFIGTNLGAGVFVWTNRRYWMSYLSLK